MEYNKQYNGLGHITVPYIPAERLVKKLWQSISQTECGK